MNRRARAFPAHAHLASKPRRRPRLGRPALPARRARVRSHGARARRRGVPHAGRPLRRRALSLDDRHGPPPLRRRALPLLRPPAARPDPAAARRLLRAARADRERVVRAAGRGRRRVPGLARGPARPLPGGRPGATDPADPALRGGRLERASPGPLRRGLLPVPGADGAVRARRRLRGRRVRAGRAAAARPEQGARAHPAAGRIRDLPDPRAPPAGKARLPPRRAAPRRQHAGERVAHGARRSSSTTRRERLVSSAAAA